MREIKLTMGLAALVDDCDYDYLNKFKWCAHRSGGNIYAERWIKGENRHIKMHREILGPPDGMDIDHANHNTLDNRRCNIRICTRSQNIANTEHVKKLLRKTSRYRGVSKVANYNKWKATGYYMNKSIYLGSYQNEMDAAIAYNNFMIKTFGEFAILNII